MSVKGEEERMNLRHQVPPGSRGKLNPIENLCSKMEEKIISEKNQHQNIATLDRLLKKDSGETLALRPWRTWSHQC